MQFIRLGILLSVFLAVCQDPSLAQFPGQQSAKEKRKEAAAKFTTASIKDPVAIPNVPAYPASPKTMKFVRGLKYSSLGKGDNCIVQTFMLKDPPEQVREFYNQQLTAYRWFVQPANPAGTQILARRVKDGASVHIMVSPTSKSASPENKAYKSSVQIRYVQWAPLTD